MLLSYLIELVNYASGVPPPPINRMTALRKE